VSCCECDHDRRIEFAHCEDGKTVRTSYQVVERNTLDLLGEGPLWSSRRNALFWVDILAPALQSYNMNTGTVSRWEMPERIGWIVERRNGLGFVIGLKAASQNCPLIRSTSRGLEIRSRIVGKIASMTLLLIVSVVFGLDQKMTVMTLRQRARCIASILTSAGRDTTTVIR